MTPEKPDIDNLIRFVRMAIADGRKLEESVVNQVDWLARQELAQEELERKVAEYKAYWVKKNAQKPWSKWFPYRIRIERR